MRYCFLFSNTCPFEDVTHLSKTCRLLIVLGETIWRKDFSTRALERRPPFLPGYETPKGKVYERSKHGLPKP